MRVTGVFCFAILFAISAFADDASEYLKFNSLPKAKKATWARQAEATFPIQFTANLNCTAVLIGPNGEALTNLHCVEDCLVKNQIVTEEPIANSKLKKMLVNSAQLPVTCNVRFAKQEPNDEKPVEVLHVFGPGWVLERNDFNDFMNEAPKEYLSLTEQGFESGGDMVLIRLPIQNNACIAIGTADFSAPEALDLVNLAYPLVYRLDSAMGGFGVTTKLFTLGMTLLFSEGKGTYNQETLLQFLDPFFLPYVELITPKGLIVTSTDTEGGASGSPLFDKEGELVAVTRSTWKGNASAYVPWTSGAVDLAPHKAWIQKNVSGLEKCQ